MSMPSGQRPGPSAWGALIAERRRGLDLSVRRAAELTRITAVPGLPGISEGRWRQIEGNCEVVTTGRYAPVRGSAEAVAAMARIVGVSIHELRDAGREDAAAMLQRVTPPITADQIRGMDPAQAAELLAQIAIALNLPIAGDSFRQFGT